MLPYYFLVFAPAVCVLLSSKVKIKQLRGKKNNVIVFFFLILLGMLFVRDISCGVDLVNYQIKFENSFVVEWDDVFKLETKYGYLVFQKIVGIFSDDFRVIIVLTSLLSICPLMYFYRKESEMPLMTIALFLVVAPFAMYFSGICQILAMGFSVPMWYMAKSKRWFVFLILGWMATTFHPTAVLLLVLYPLYHVKFTKNSLLFLVPALLGVFIFNRHIMQLVLYFMDSERYEISPSNAYTVLLLLVIFVLYCYVIPDENTLDQDIVALRNILLLCVVIQIFASVQNLIMRLNYYFLIFIPVLIPKIARHHKPQMRQVVRLSIVIINVVFIALFFYTAHFEDEYLNIYPYISMWK